MKDISLRLMTKSDVPAADELRRLIGWNQTREKWLELLALEPHGCFVATDAGRVVGTVTTTTYGQALAWIGMMLVHPEHRRRGIATRLMRQAVDYLQGRGVQCIRLDATPAGFPLYQQLGFVSEWTLTRWQRSAASQAVLPPVAPADVRALSDADWPAVDALDTAAFGAPRSRLLRRLAQESRRALVWPASGDVAGWGLLRPGANADYLGPLVCSSAEGALTLARALLGAAENRPVFWDVPDLNEPARTAVQKYGFTPVRPLTRMRLGPNSVPSEPRAQFAIADPAVG